MIKLLLAVITVAFVIGFTHYQAHAELKCLELGNTAQECAKL